MVLKGILWPCPWVMAEFVIVTQWNFLLASGLKTIMQKWLNRKMHMWTEIIQTQKESPGRSSADRFRGKRKKKKKEKNIDPFVPSSVMNSFHGHRLLFSEPDRKKWRQSRPGSWGGGGGRCSRQRYWWAAAEVYLGEVNLLVSPVVLKGQEILMGGVTLIYFLWSSLKWHPHTTNPPNKQTSTTSTNNNKTM